MSTDPTGLRIGNRAQFLAYVARRLAALPDPFPELAVFSVVLSGLAAFHQTYGAASAEDLLRRIYAGVSQFAPDTVIGRIADGQFSIVYEFDSEWTNVQDIAADLMAAIDGSSHGRQPSLTEPPCLGAVVHYGRTQAGTSLDVATEMLRQAKLAVEIAPRYGRDGFMLYSPTVDEQVRSAIILDQSLRQAIARNEFLLHYQVLVDLRTMDLTGLEGLIRWGNPTTGLRLPDDFIASAETSGLIVQIGASVLDIAMQQVAGWAAAGWAAPRVAVNVAAAQLQDPNFRDIVIGALTRAQVEPASLELEMTERTLVTWSRATRRLFDELREMGVTLAIDDFGTGYSSLQYLRDMPISKLKIDRTFVRHMATNKRDAALVKAIVAIGDALDMDVVAEGIETIEQADALLECGCTTGQGFLFSRPVPAGVIPGLPAILRQQHAARTRA